MDKQIMIDVRDVTMEFNMSSYKVDSLKEYFVRLIQRRLMFNSFIALNDVSFQVAAGCIKGIIGQMEQEKVLFLT